MAVEQDATAEAAMASKEKSEVDAHNFAAVARLIVNQDNGRRVAKFVGDGLLIPLTA